MLVNIDLNKLVNELSEAVADSYLCDNDTLKRRDIEAIVSSYFKLHNYDRINVVSLTDFAEMQVVYNGLELYQRSYTGENEHHLKLAQDMFQSYHDDYVKDVKE